MPIVLTRSANQPYTDKTQNLCRSQSAVEPMAEDQNALYVINYSAFNQGRNAQYDLTIRRGAMETLIARHVHAILAPLGRK